MSLPSRRSFAQVRYGLPVAFAVAAGSAFLSLRSVSSLPSVPSGDGISLPAFGERAGVVLPPGRDWSSFISGSPAAARTDGASSISRRYRLVGTMVAYSSRLTDERKAVLDDRVRNVQKIVSEGDTMDGISVCRILRDRVTLRSGSHEETLVVKFEKDGGSAPAAGTGTQSVASAGTPTDGAALENKFGGRQVGENKWVFDRGPILAYYSELMDNPDRLVKIFDSFKPVYGPDRRVTGYRINQEGEQDFFRAVGLHEGDVVRSVNTMRMTSRRRAEFFIREFIDNRANSFSMDIERGGQNVSQTYEAK